MVEIIRTFFARELVILFSLCFVMSCTHVPEADFYEVEGIISINAQNLPEQNNWHVQPTLTSESMVSFYDTTAVRGTLTFPFYVRNPGEYTVYLLANLTEVNSPESELPLQILDQNQFLIQSSRLIIDKSPVLKWQTEDAGSGQPVSVYFESAGHYELRVESGGQSGFVVDKLHLTLNDENQPYGFALPETVHPGQDPFLAKRDERIVIPPAWAFGTLYGGMNSGLEARQLADELIEENISVDGIWVKMDSLQMVDNTNGIGQTQTDFHQNHIMKGVEPVGRWFGQHPDEILLPVLEFDFLKIPEPSSVNTVKSLFESVMQRGHVPESRGFVMSWPNIAHQPESKTLPTLHSGIYDGSADSKSPSFEDLLKQIELSADLRLSTYEIPYLMHFVPMNNPAGEPEISEELFIRWIQFAAFHTIMGLNISPNSDFSSLFAGYSDLAEQQFKALTELRHRLFPYIYSLAHLVRATREKPVRGDGRNTTQFQLGDALLVAPIFESGEDERLVYLPPGTWYDYWDGTEYDGGSSWIVEAPIDKIPVFVRAGSIIPYRNYSRSILAGSNDDLIFEIYGGGASSFRLYEDDGVTTRYQLGEFSSTAFRYFEHDDFSTFTIGRMVRSYQGQSQEKELELRFKFVDEPVRITANEEELGRGEGENQWHFDRDSQTLIVNWMQPNYQKTDFRIDF